jgi:hypothetical protein
MSLEAAFHQRWAATAALEGLLPAGRLKTGLVRGGNPSASLACTSCRTVLRTSAGDRVDEVGLEVRVRHDDYDAGRAIADQVTAAFDNSRFAVSAAEHVIHARRTGASARPQAGGGWEFLVEFLVQVHREKA